MNDTRICLIAIKQLALGLKQLNNWPDPGLETIKQLALGLKQLNNWPGPGLETIKQLA